MESRRTLLTGSCRFLSSRRNRSAYRVSSQLHLLSSSNTDAATGDSHELLPGLHVKRDFDLDPGSPYEDEQSALATIVDELKSEGRRVTKIILTHLHPDHVGGVNALRTHLGDEVVVCAHEQTADALTDIKVDQLINDEDLIQAKRRACDYFARAAHAWSRTRTSLFS